MGKLGAGWPADLGTVSMHCQLLLGVPISYIHFLMNCFIICSGEFLILQIFDVTRHLLDSVAFSLCLTILVLQFCPFGWCHECILQGKHLELKKERFQTWPVLIPWLMSVLLGFWGILSWGCSVLTEPLWVQSFSAQVCCSRAYCRHQMSYQDKKKEQISSHLFVCLTPSWVPNLEIIIKTL